MVNIKSWYRVIILARIIFLLFLHSSIYLKIFTFDYEIPIFVPLNRSLWPTVYITFQFDIFFLVSKGVFRGPNKRWGNQDV